MTKEQEASVMREFLPSVEWEILQGHLRKKLSSSLEALVQAKDLESVFRFQERIRSLKELVELPKRLIEEAKHGEELS